MSGIKVTYFDFSGSRGEEVRLALAIAGVPFDDNRISRAALDEMKAGLPFGTVPVMEIEGQGTFAQTNAMLRLIGRLHGLYPDDVYEGARVDALLEVGEEFRHKVGATLRIADPAARKAAREELSAGYIPRWGAAVEAHLAGPWAMGERLTVADIKLYMLHRWVASGMLDDIPANLFDGCPKLTAIAQAVHDHPAVAARRAAA